MDNKSIVLNNLRKSLFYKINSQIVVNISENNTRITASNILTEDFKHLIFISNSPYYPTDSSYLVGINVYLDNDTFPINIPGLFLIVKSKMLASEADSFIHYTNSYTPFINGFKNGMIIDEVVDKLSVIFEGTPDTYNRIKKYELIFDSKPVIDLK